MASEQGQEFSINNSYSDEAARHIVTQFWSQVHRVAAAVLEARDDRDLHSS